MRGNDFDAEEQTFSYQPETGSWTIDVPLQDLRLHSSLNALTARAIDNLSDASRGFLKPTAARFESVRVDPDGRIADAAEESKTLLESDDRLSANFKMELEGEQTGLLTTLFIDCDTVIVLPRGQSGENSSITLPNSGQLYLGYVIDLDSNEIPFLTNCTLSFETSTDVWLTRTREPGTMQLRDNESAASQNAPLLENFLRKWEEATGQPITEWESRLYRDRIFRYGFKQS